MEFLIRHKTIVAFISFFLFSIISLSLQSTSFTMSFEGIGSAIIMPFQKGYHYAQDGMHMLWAGFTELSDVRDELEKTREKLKYYESNTESLAQIKRENDQLRKLLQMRERIIYPSIPAQIISKDPDNWFRTIIINRGSSDGIKENMPVVAFSGDTNSVIGKIIEVRGSVSRILPIISPDMKIGVMLEDSEIPGLLEGFSSNSNVCIVNYISKSVQIPKRSSIVTSAQGGVFPKGLKVGTVIKTISSKSSTFQKAIIKPIIDFNRVGEVFIILKVPDQELIELVEGKE